MSNNKDRSKTISDLQRVDGGREQLGCEMCGDFPVTLYSRCHPTAPLRVEMISPGELVFYCYVPECNREVARMKATAP